MQHRLFEGHEHAELYAQYRPVYPQGVVDAVLEFSKKTDQSPPFDHILDVGCGNGQATKLFASHAKKITAIDVSENQIKQAISSNEYVNIEYCVGKGEEIPVEDASVDIITSAQAIHWVDLVKFFAECERVLKPDGYIALYGYDFPRFMKVGNCEGIDGIKLQENIVASTKRLSKVISILPWGPRFKLVEDKYEGIYNFLPSGSKMRNDGIKMHNKLSLEHTYNYLCTWSGYQTHMENARKKIVECGGEVSEGELRKYDVFADFIEDLKKIWNVADDKLQVEIEWDVFMLFSYRPFITFT